MQTISREVIIDPSETTRRASSLKKRGKMARKVSIAYLQGTLGDGTYSKIHRTFRISQSNQEWLFRLKKLINDLGEKSWIYKEGKTRSVSVLETTAKCLSRDFDPSKLSTISEKVAYVRGYFDAEGGVPKNLQNRFYIQFVQKNFKELQKVRKILEQLGIECGKMHNPSAKVDPNYWRFFVRAISYQRFIEFIGSWHPRKNFFLQRGMKI